MKILLCDDHLLLAEALESLLKIAGHEVTVTADPGEAPALAAASPGRVRAGPRLPGPRRPRPAARGRETVPDAKIVVLSAQRDPDLVRTAIDLGARGYLCKDVGSSRWSTPSTRSSTASS